MEESPSISYVIDASNSNRNLRQAGSDPLHWDVLLVHESGGAVKSHRALLAVNSGYFRKYFSREWVKHGKNRAFFRSAELTFESLEAIVASVYSEPVQIGQANVYEIHSAANYLEMDDLSRKCSQFLANTLAVDNICSVERYASNRTFPGSDRLLSECMSFIDGHIMDLNLSGQLEELEFAEIEEIISRPTLEVRAEIDVLYVVISWLNQAWSARYCHGAALLEFVQWPLVNKREMLEVSAVDSFAKIACKDDAEKDAKFAIMELLLAPAAQSRINPQPDSIPRPVAREVKLAARQPPGQMYVFDPPTKHGLMSFRIYDVQTKFWRKEIVVCTPSHHDGAKLVKMFIFRGRILALTANDEERIESLTLHLFEDWRFTESWNLALPDTESALGLWRTCPMTFTPPFLTVPCYELCAILVYDLRDLSVFSPKPDNARRLRGHELPFCHHVDDIKLQSAFEMSPPGALHLNHLALTGGLWSSAVRYYNLADGMWTHGPSTHRICCSKNYLFSIGPVLYSVGGEFICKCPESEQCKAVFEYLPTLSVESQKVLGSDFHDSEMSGSDSQDSEISGSDSQASDHVKWVKGPNLATGCQVVCHYVLNGRLYLVGTNTFGDDKSPEHIVQSIDLENLEPGWHDENDFFKGTKPLFVGIV